VKNTRYLTVFVLLVVFALRPPANANGHEHSKLLASDGNAGDWSGFPVSISGDYYVIGASQDSDYGDSSGSVYIFSKGGIPLALEISGPEQLLVYSSGQFEATLHNDDGSQQGVTDAVSWSVEPETHASIDANGLLTTNGIRGDITIYAVYGDFDAEASTTISTITDAVFVPGQYETIQAAIDAVNDGNVVVVAPGTYIGDGNYNIDFRGKAITVRSLDGPESCIINCGHVSGRRGFIFSSDEGSGSVLSGFTITGGKLYGGTVAGGGIYCSNASPMIENCIITDNWAYGMTDQSAKGGGIYAESNSSPTILNCIISENGVVGGDGASDSMGYSHSGRPGYGGGICCDTDSSVTIVNCLVANNEVVAGDGGSSMVWGSSGGDAYGGGIYLGTNGHLIAQNCTITGNVVTPGVKGDSGHANPGWDGTAYGAGVCCEEDSNASIENCIIWGDSGTDEVSGNPAVTYSDVAGAYPGDGNIDADPLFVAGPSVDYYLSQIAAGQTSDSPCVDAGSDAAEKFNMDMFGTRTDGVRDESMVDMGYHYSRLSSHGLLGLVAPNGGESLISSETFVISWMGLCGISDVSIEYSSDNGLNWLSVNPPNRGNKGHYNWELPTVNSSECLVRISDTEDSNVVDVSYNTFTIRPELTVLSPNGGELWLSDRTRTISWQSKGEFSGVVLEYSLDSGLTWILIDSPNGSDEGTHVWQPPDVSSRQCLIRVSNADDPSIRDTSDGVFTLVDAQVVKTLYVPGQYPTIQAAIDDSNHFDTIIVADGTYRGEGNREIDFKGKSIIVHSQNGPENCIIDCENSKTGFYFRSYEDENSVLRGFTITRGYGGRGGAIHCYPGSPTISECVITHNEVMTQGAGIYCRDSHPKIVGCTISDNSVLRYGGNECGGGIYCASSNATISNCTISNNDGTNYGGGIYCISCNPTISNCVISSNSASYGGGIVCRNSSPLISECVIAKNKSHHWGGGIMMKDESSPTIIGCKIDDNYADRGGGVFGYGDSVNSEIRNCLISGNHAEIAGGGLYSFRGFVGNCIVSGNYAGDSGGGFYGCDGPIINCSIIGNSAANLGGGLYYGDLPNRGSLTNCILAFNRRHAIYEGYYSADPFVEHCLLYDNPDGDLYDDDTSSTLTGSLQINTLDEVEDSLDGDPCLVESGFWDSNETPDDLSDDFWVDGDYHLWPHSPCVDAGYPNSTFDTNAVDLDGEPRVMLEEVDIGADEVGEKQADFTRNGVIDFEDFAVLAQSWHSEPSQQGWFALCDIVWDEHCDILDLARFVNDWLWEATWHSD